MGEWKLRDYIIAGVVLSSIIAIAYIMVGSLAVEYETPGIVDSGFSDRYDRFSNQTGDIAEMWNASSNAEGLGLVSATVEIFKGGIAVVSLIFGGFGLIGGQVNSLASDFGIPVEIFAIVSVLLIVSLSVLIIWGVINFLNKTGPL